MIKVLWLNILRQTRNLDRQFLNYVDAKARLMMCIHECFKWEFETAREYAHVVSHLLVLSYTCVYVILNWQCRLRVYLWISSPCCQWRRLHVTVASGGWMLGGGGSFFSFRWGRYRVFLWSKVSIEMRNRRYGRTGVDDRQPTSDIRHPLN